MKFTSALSVLAAVAVTSPAAAETFSIGTNPQGSAAYATGAAVARVAKEALDLRARVVPQGGPVVTLPLVNSGRLNASIANSMIVNFAYRGGAMFKGRVQKDLRVVAVLRTLRLGVFVDKDSKIETMADLKGVRISSAFSKQRNMQVFWSGLLAMAQLSFKDVKGVPVPNGIRGVDDFMSGKVDASMFSITSGKVRQANAAKGIRFLSLPDDPAAVKRMQTIAPGTVVETVTPSAKYPGIAGPTRILAAPFVVMASAKTSEEVIYKLTRALAANKKAMVGVFKGMGDFNPNRMHVDFGVPYHPGAEKYFRETGQIK